MKNNLLDLSDIALFVEVAQAQSFSRAAVRLGMPVPTLSRRIAAMERRLGVQLFQRSTRKVALIPTAQPYLERCVEVMDAAVKAQSAIDPAGRMKGTIRVSMPVDLGVELIGPIIGLFVQQHPDINVNIDLSSRAADLFRDPVDLVFRVGKTMDDRVVARKVATIASALYAAPAFLERHGTITHPEQLTQVPCLNLLTASGTMPWSVGRLRWPQAPGPCRLGANSVALIRALAEQGHGVALLPRHLAHDSEKAKRLVRVLPDEVTPDWPLYAITATRMVSKELRLLIAHIKQGLSDSGAWLAPAAPVADE